MRRIVLSLALLTVMALPACTTASGGGEPQTASAASPEAASAEPAKAAPAPIASLVRQVEIPYEQFTLDNGLRVIVHEDR